MSGTISVTGPSDIPARALPDTWKADTRIANTNCLIPAAGPMNRNIPLMYGFPTISDLPGDPTGTDAGYGILTTVMYGTHTIPGAGIPIIMEDGIGAPSTDGTGYRDTTGLRAG